ncbi:hypothetical protein [Anabaena sp. CCY 0017]|uniref:hypothetical protein n=1 Tax=Anabaena sp. CCY 0017 TaxID=3103866 RepID=UPI0039C699E2
MNTKWLPKTSSANIKQRLRQVNWLEILALVGLGLIIAAVEANLRFPLRLPGWRGLIWLTPLVATRLSTSRFGAASITSFSAAGCSWLIGVRYDPYDWFFYLVVGELLDLAYHQGRKWKQQVWFWAIAAGLIHLIKPLTRIIISSSGVWYGFLSSGYIYPLTTHLLFGAIAGIVGSFAVLATKNLRKS